MRTQVKRILLRVVAMLMIVAGAYGGFILSDLVFDRSYMMTLEILGKPGAATSLRVRFVLCLIVALVGLTMLLLSFKRNFASDRLG